MFSVPVSQTKTITELARGKLYPLCISLLCLFCSLRSRSHGDHLLPAFRSHVTKGFDSGPISLTEFPNRNGGHRLQSGGFANATLNWHSKTWSIAKEAADLGATISNWTGSTEPESTFVSLQLSGHCELLPSRLCRVQKHSHMVTDSGLGLLRFLLTYELLFLGTFSGSGVRLGTSGKHIGIGLSISQVGSTS